MCNNNLLLVHISQIIICFNYGKMIRRIADFKKIFKIMLQVTKYFAGNSIFFLTLTIILALLTHSLFSDDINYCSSSRIYFIDSQNCERYAGTTRPYLVNYSKVWEAALSIYAAFNRVYWFSLLELSYMVKPSLLPLHEAVHFMVLLTLSTYMYLAFQGMAISLHYITIERLSIHNAGESLSKVGQQLVMTEELLIQKGLPVQPRLHKNKVSDFCELVVNARCWKVLYCLIVLGGFTFNMTQ
jgi:hypothetical protein